MFPKIFTVYHGTYSYVVLTEDRVYRIDTLTLTGPDHFRALIADPSVNRISFPLSSIERLEVSQQASTVDVFSSEDEDDEGHSLMFAEEDDKQTFVTTVSRTLGMSKSEEEVSTASILAFTLPVLAIAAALFTAVLLVEEQDVLDARGSGSKGRRLVGIVKLLYIYIGKTGLLFLTGAATLFGLYLLIDGLRNRDTIETYRR